MDPTPASAVSADRQARRTTVSPAGYQDDGSPRVRLAMHARTFVLVRHVEGLTSISEADDAGEIGAWFCVASGRTVGDALNQWASALELPREACVSEDDVAQATPRVDTAASAPVCAPSIVPASDIPIQRLDAVLPFPHMPGADDVRRRRVVRHGAAGATHER